MGQVEWCTLTHGAGPIAGARWDLRLEALLCRSRVVVVAAAGAEASDGRPRWPVAAPSGAQARTVHQGGGVGLEASSQMCGAHG
eukprot:5250242-Pleurochrysis_carterae.AAC.1